MGRSVYATIEDIRAAGLPDSSTHTDERVRSLLELASEIVEAITDQVFGPTFKQFDANGSGRKIVEDNDRNKILEVIQVQVLRFGLLRTSGFLSDTPQILTSEDFTVQERHIQLRPNDVSSSRMNRAFRDIRENRFPNDQKNVRVTGVFGWLDLSPRFETALAESLASDATTIKLLETGDVEKDDLLLVDQRFWVIVKGVTVVSDSSATPPTIGEVSIDASPKAAEIDGTAPTVVRYGKVPRLIREAVIRTLLAHSAPLGSDEEQDRLAAGRIRREETDNYEVEFFASSGSEKANTGTGDPVADAFLSKFRAPTVAARWV
jgi:hypothetical protein